MCTKRKIFSRYINDGKCRLQLWLLPAVWGVNVGTDLSRVTLNTRMGVSSVYVEPRESWEGSSETRVLHFQRYKGSRTLSLSVSLLLSCHSRGQQTIEYLDSWITPKLSDRHTVWLSHDTLTFIRSVNQHPEDETGP